MPFKGQIKHFFFAGIHHFVEISDKHKVILLPKNSLLNQGGN